MANDPFTIRIFVLDGDPEGVRLIDRMNWTGLGIVFPRQKWPTTKQRAEFSRAGVYILVGYPGEGDEQDVDAGTGELGALFGRRSFLTRENNSESRPIHPVD